MTNPVAGFAYPREFRRAASPVSHQFNDRFPGIAPDFVASQKEVCSGYADARSGICDFPTPNNATNRRRFPGKETGRPSKNRSRKYTNFSGVARRWFRDRRPAEIHTFLIIWTHRVHEIQLLSTINANLPRGNTAGNSSPRQARIKFYSAAFRAENEFLTR